MDIRFPLGLVVIFFFMFMVSSNPQLLYLTFLVYKIKCGTKEED